MNTATAQPSTDRPAASPSPTMLLLERLKDLGLSQADVARETGLSQAKVSRWFRGQLPESADEIFSLLELEKKRREYLASLRPPT